jgi:transposase
LWGHGLEVAIVNPRAVRRFAEAMGWLEKTDKIDAGVIAWFAEARGVEPTPLAGEAQKRLTALVVRLSQLTDLEVAQTNQRRLVDDPCWKPSPRC